MVSIYTLEQQRFARCHQSAKVYNIIYTRFVAGTRDDFLTCEICISRLKDGNFPDINQNKVISYYIYRYIIKLQDDAKIIYIYLVYRDFVFVHI